jgi:cyclopropane fatty-acyl-phospholipid synthase-like methyltransferase
LRAHHDHLRAAYGVSSGDAVLDIGCGAGLTTRVFVQGFQSTSSALASLSDDDAARTVQRLRDMLAAHDGDERGVVLGSRSWLITARRRRSDQRKC